MKEIVARGRCPVGLVLNWPLVVGVESRARWDGFRFEELNKRAVTKVQLGTELRWVHDAMSS